MENYYLGRTDITEETLRWIVEKFKQDHNGCAPTIMVAPRAVAPDLLRVVKAAEFQVEVRASAGVPINTVGLE